MTTISLTSGELLDIINQLNEVADNLDDGENYTLASYYAKLAQQFEMVHIKLKDFVPENRVANLVLVANWCATNLIGTSGASGTLSPLII